MHKTSTNITQYLYSSGLDRFSCNAQATNSIEVMKKKQFGMLDNKSLIRLIVVLYQ